MTKPVGPAAALVAPDGRPLEVDALEVGACILDPDQVAVARQAAYRHGLVLERDGLGLLGLGLAARIALPGGLDRPGAARQAAAVLAALAPTGPATATGPTSVTTVPAEPAAVPVALGALPFERAAPGHLSIPAVTVVAGEKQAAEGALAVFVAPAGALEAIRRRFVDDGPASVAGGRLEGDGDGELPDQFTLSSTTSHGSFRRLVAEAVEAIAQGGLDKVVLARGIDVLANRPFRQDDLLGRLRALHPSCAAFAVDGFLGASPELLCRRRGRHVTSVPLAGTVARSGDPEEDARLAAGLLASAKERAEHATVVRAILDALAPCCPVLEASAEPTVLELRNVAHLATTVRGELAPRSGGPAPSALELAATLHPTPAVGGWPTDAALAYLAAHEGLDRDRYAGPVGYLDAAGDGEWWVGIRSALVDGSRARLLAGVGVVAGSDPAGELAETQLKLQALLAAAVRP